MKQKINPFTPGAGIQPAELAGRKRLLKALKWLLSEFFPGGWKGDRYCMACEEWGKTVLLQRLYGEARDRVKCVFLEVSETAPFAQDDYSGNAKSASFHVHE